MPPNRVQKLMMQPSGGNSEGGCGSVESPLSRTERALEVAHDHLETDHLRHLDKELSAFILTRVAGLLRLQNFPAVARKRFGREQSTKGPFRGTRGGSQ